MKCGTQKPKGPAPKTTKGATNLLLNMHCWDLRLPRVITLLRLQFHSSDLTFFLWFLGEENVIQVEAMTWKDSVKIPIATLKAGGPNNQVLLDLSFPDPPVTFTLIQGKFCISTVFNLIYVIVLF